MFNQVPGRHHFRAFCFCWKGYRTDSRLSNGNELHPSSGRYLSLLIRSGFHKVFAIDGKEAIKASRFNFTYGYIDDVLSINNPKFKNYLCQMFPIELEINDTTESNTSASYLDLLRSNGRDIQLRTAIDDKLDDINIYITNMSSNNPS